MSFPAYDISDQIVICVSTWNRPTITRRCLQRLHQTRAKALLYVLDDGSDGDTSYMDGLADKVIRQPHGKGGSLGVAENRIRLTREALKSGREFVYHTDADCVHDPEWVSHFGMMVRHWEDYDIYSLFNSPVQAGRGFSINNPQMDQAEVCQRTECPGASLMMRASALQMDPPYGITEERVKIHGAWDHCWSVYLADYKTLISTRSFVDHYHAGGIHEDCTDIGLNLTDSLLKERQKALS